MKDFIEIADFSPDQLRELLDRAIADKRRFLADELPAACPRKVLALIFEKPSLRTRVSFESAIIQLGGSAIYLTDKDIGLGKREPVADVARVLGRMCDAIAARTFSHESVVELAGCAAIPVINALTDFSHPCQAMADLMTFLELRGDPAGATVAFVGDGNNVARSLAVLCAKLGANFVLACPAGYELEAEFVRKVESVRPGSFRLTHEPRQAVADAAVVYTDTWVSMGQEDDRPRRLRDFEGFQINEALLAAAPKGTLVMHCLPAYRGLEITDAVMAAHAETIFAQAANRLHFQRALVNVLVAEGGIA